MDQDRKKSGAPAETGDRAALAEQAAETARQAARDAAEAKTPEELESALKRAQEAAAAAEKAAEDARLLQQESEKQLQEARKTREEKKEAEKPKTLIIYVSRHHGNTKKIVDAAAEVLDADLINYDENKKPDISGYDLIGIASGIYFNSFDKELMNHMMSLPYREDQAVFAMATCGLRFRNYLKELKRFMGYKRVRYAGSFICRGYCTWGPFKSGLAKGRPNEEDLAEARAFARGLLTPKKRMWNF